MPLGLVVILAPIKIVQIGNLLSFCLNLINSSSPIFKIALMKNMRFHALVLVLFGLSFIQATQKEYTDKENVTQNTLLEPAPPLLFESTHHDFGVVNDQEVIRKLFYFKNTTDYPIYIKELQVGDRATIVSAPTDTLLAGESSYISFYLSLKHSREQFNVRRINIVYRIDRPFSLWKEQFVSVEWIRAEIENELQIPSIKTKTPLLFEYPFYDFGPVNDKAPLTKRLHFKNNTAYPILIRRSVVSDGASTVSFERDTIQAGEWSHIRLRSMISSYGRQKQGIRVFRRGHIRYMIIRPTNTTEKQQFFTFTCTTDSLGKYGAEIEPPLNAPSNTLNHPLSFDSTSLNLGTSICSNGVFEEDFMLKNISDYPIKILQLTPKYKPLNLSLIGSLLLPGQSTFVKYRKEFKSSTRLNDNLSVRYQIERPFESVRTLTLRLKGNAKLR